MKIEMTETKNQTTTESSKETEGKRVLEERTNQKNDPVIERINNISKPLNISGELYTKHPLEHTWVLWYFKLEKGKDWSEGQKKVATVDTAEDFWALYNYIQPASLISTGCDYSFFKEGIFPMWEDESNKNGGRWIVNVDKKMRNVETDNLWLEALLAVVGEAFDMYSDEICGLVVNIRHRNDKIALWTRNYEPYDVTRFIGSVFKDRLQISKEVSIDYQPHHNSASKNSVMHKSYHML